MKRTTFVVPGEDLGVWAPLTLGISGTLGAIAAAAILATRPTPARASEDPPRESAPAMAPAPSVERAPEMRPGVVATASASVSPMIAACPPVRVAFASNAIGPSRGAIEDLDRFAAWLGAHPNTTLVVSGHADAIGTEDGNLRLSHMRAESVARELSARGVARARLTVQGYGAYQPLEGVLEDAADNRRVVVHVRGECPRGFEEVIGP